MSGKRKLVKGLALFACGVMVVNPRSVQAETQQEGEGEGYNAECGINRNITDAYSGQYHQSAYQPLTAGYTDAGTVPSLWCVSPGTKRCAGVVDADCEGAHRV